MLLVEMMVNVLHATFTHLAAQVRRFHQSPKALGERLRIIQGNQKPRLLRTQSLPWWKGKLAREVKVEYDNGDGRS